MKQFLLLSLTCVLLCKASMPLLPGAENVNCTSCPFGQTKCDICSAQSCIALRELDTDGNKNVDGTYRGCIAPNGTCNPLAFTFSPGENRQVKSMAVCCTTNNCNENISQSVPPTSDIPNGVNCDACEEYNKTDCTSNQTIACKGAEVKCISLTGQRFGDKNESFTIRGCATASACDLVKGDHIVYKSNTYQISEKPSCLNGASLSTLSSTLLLLPAVVPLLLARILS